MTRGTVAARGALDDEGGVKSDKTEDQTQPDRHDTQRPYPWLSAAQMARVLAELAQEYMLDNLRPIGQAVEQLDCTNPRPRRSRKELSHAEADTDAWSDVDGPHRPGVLGYPRGERGGASSSPPNWAQVDRTGFWNCTSVADGFALIPDLSVALTISGGPVLLTLNLAIEGIPGVSATLRPVIDGIEQTADDLIYSRPNTRTDDHLVYSRIYPLPAGAHTFQISISCIGGEANIRRGWLAVYELPAVRK